MHRFTDVAGRRIRLTDERLQHVERRPEMVDQLDRIEETLAEPDEVRESNHDADVHLFYRRFAETPVTEKYLLVVANARVDDPFVVTAFYTDRIKSGKPIDVETESSDTPE